MQEYGAGTIVLGKKGKGMWLRGELLLSMSEAMVSIPSTISFVYLPTYKIQLQTLTKTPQNACMLGLHPQSRLSAWHPLPKQHPCTVRSL
jgi:uncharacterized protein (DUF2062 family)